MEVFLKQVGFHIYSLHQTHPSKEAEESELGSKRSSGEEGAKAPEQQERKEKGYIICCSLRLHGGVRGSGFESSEFGLCSQRMGCYCCCDSDSRES